MAETKKFVDLTGLDHFWGKVDTIITSRDNVVKAEAAEDAAAKDAALETKITTAYTKAINATVEAEATTNTKMQADITALETTVGNDNSGLVKDVKDLEATVSALGDIEGGSISDMIDAKIAALDVADAAVAGEYVSSVSEVDGKIAVTRVALPDYTDAFAAKANASDLTTHTGNTEIHITAAERTAWSAAEQNAKDYADGLNTAMDARVDALEAQDKYVAADVTAAITKAQEDAQTYADGLNTAMDGRVDKLEAINHEAIAAQAAADAVAAVVANAPEDLNTLKEVADYIAADKTKASEIETSISDLGKADAKIREDFAAADATLETSLKSYADQAEADAKSYTDSLVKDSEGKSLFDAAGAAATAKSEAIEAVAADATTKANAAQAAAIAAAATDATSKADAAQAAAIAAAATDATSKADAAQAAAIAAAATDAESKYQVKGDYEAAGTAAGLNTAMDARVKVLEGIDHEAYKAADTTLETTLKAYADQAEADAVAAIVAVSNTDIDGIFA